MSILYHCRNGFQVKEKGYTAEEYTFPVRMSLGRMENILRTVTLCGVLSFWLLVCLPFCRECGVSPDSRFFVTRHFERKREK